jgi:hypothetical protein
MPLKEEVEVLSFQGVLHVAVEVVAILSVFFIKINTKKENEIK